MKESPVLTAAALIDRYEAFFIDAYGVLNDAQQALAGAAEFLERLNATEKPWCILSNDASHSIETTHRRCRSFGLPVAPDRIVTSGSLLVEHFRQHQLVGQRCLVLGTDDARAYVTDAGGVIATLDDESASVLVVGDDDGFPFLDGMNAVVTVLLRRLAQNLPLHLIVPNPDLVFPRSGGGFGITAGAMAAMIEQILLLRAPDGQYKFTALGKPNLPIFMAAKNKLGLGDGCRIVMLGDQLITVIREANRFGIDSALVLTGVSTRDDVARFGDRPTWIVPDLSV